MNNNPTYEELENQIKELEARLAFANKELIF